MSQNPRIDELRRRVQADPASIAFAALAEEYRRDGNFTDAIDTCVAGLKRHPSYLSAHVTLGRALIEVGRFEEAEHELQLVLKAAPENLAAIRGMAEIHHRRRDQAYDEASALAHLQHQPHEETPAVSVGAEPSREPAAFEPAPYEPASYEPVAPAAFAAALDEAPRDEPPQYQPPAYDPPGTFEFPPVTALAPDYAALAFEMSTTPVNERNPQLEALERFLDAILASRTALAAY